MDYNALRVLHEYEITDATGQHFASLVYLRECSNTQGVGNDVSDDEVDQVMRESIRQGCNVVRELPARIISLDFEVEELNRRLREEYQMKGYFTLSSVSELKGDVPVNYSRITIHTSILVKKEVDVPYFENVGNHKVVDNAELLDFMLLKHLQKPVYTMQEHPLVYGIVCYKEASKQGKVYFLYRHNNAIHESILAIVDVEEKTTQLLLGADKEQSTRIQTFAASLKAQNNLSPLYQATYLTEYAPCYVMRLNLNRERDLFTKAKALLLEALAEGKDNNPHCEAMATYLEKMIEA